MHQYPAPECVLKRVRGWIKGDWRAILEDNFFAPFYVEVNRIQMCLWTKRGKRTVSIKSIWSFKKHETDGRVVTNLLEHYFSTVFHASLIRFAQNRVQRLFKSVRRVTERDGESYEILHALYRVGAESGCCQVSGCVQREFSNCGQNRTRRHALDRKRDFVKLKIAWDDHAANLLD